MNPIYDLPFGPGGRGDVSFNGNLGDLGIPDARELLGPDVVMRHWLDNYYIPPQFRQLFEQLFPQIQGEYNNRIGQIMGQTPGRFSQQTPSGQNNIYNPGAGSQNMQIPTGNGVVQGTAYNQPTRNPQPGYDMSKAQGFQNGGGYLSDIPTFTDWMASQNPFQLLQKYLPRQPYQSNAGALNQTLTPEFGQTSRRGVF